MRNMSFSLTTPQFLDGSKTVTRRMGWRFLKGGEHVMAVEKGMGLKKGEKVKRLGEIVIVKATQGRLLYMKKTDLALEGFPKMTVAEFIVFFCKANKCNRFNFVTRIKFRRVRETI